MPRVDDYIQAKKIAAQRLQEDSFTGIAQRSGFETCDDQSFRIPFLDSLYRVSYPQFEFRTESGEKKEIPIQEQVLILHYLLGAGTAPLIENWISYREIPEASFYFSVFVKRAIDPLKKVFGKNLSGFSKAAHVLSGKVIAYGDVGFEFLIFPKIPIRVILWEGDHEFTTEANIVFDETIKDILSPEDIAWMSGMLVYGLIRLSH